MKIKIGAIVLLAVAIIGIAGLVYWRLSFSKRRDLASAQPIRSFSGIHARMKSLASQTDALTLHDLGSIACNNCDWPILLLSYRSSAPIRLRVLLLGGVHGNEPAGVRCLMQFTEELAGGKLEYPGISFDIIPVANPWGWVHGRRCNGEGHDLNRDFNSFNAKESEILRDVCHRNPYDLMVDFHEDSHVAGFYLYRLAQPNEALCRRIIESVRAGGYPIHDGRVSKIFHSKDGIIACSMGSLRFARAIRQLSASNYFRLQGCPNTFLLETPRRLPIETRVAMHRTALEAILQNLMEDAGI